MARILEEPEKKIRCPHCDKLIGFTVDDVWTSSNRGLEYSYYGWIDLDYLWHYIKCPNCNNTISVNDDGIDILNISDLKYLEKKYEKKNEDY